VFFIRIVPTEAEFRAAKWFSFNDEIVSEIKNPFGSKKTADDSNTACVYSVYCTPVWLTGGVLPHRRRMQSKDAYMLVYSSVPESDSSSELSQGTLSSEPPSAAMEEVTLLNTTIDDDLEKYREQYARRSLFFPARHLL
jgi:hypothetical protein